MGRPLTFGELFGPLWSGTALRSSPSPLMVKARSPCLLCLPCSCPLPYPPHFVLRWGGPSQVLGVSPHFLYQSAHEGCARLLRGWLPLSFGLESAPPPPLLPIPEFSALGVHTVRGVSFGLLRGLGVSPLPACRELGAYAAMGVSPPPLPPGSGVSLPPARTCHALGAHAAIQGGPPLPWGLARALCAFVVRPLIPPALAR